MIVSVDKKRDKNDSAISIIRTKEIETEYFDCQFKLAELNIYLLDEVLIQICRQIYLIKLELDRTGLIPKKKENLESIAKILKSLLISPMTLHVFFKSLSLFSSEFQFMAKYQMILNLMESLKSFHFQAPKYQQSVCLLEVQFD